MLKLSVAFAYFFIFIFGLSPLQAKRACDADSIVDEMCTHLSENSDQSHIKSSDGGLIPNNFYVPRTIEATETTYVKQLMPNFEDFLNADLAFQVDVEIVLKSSNAKNWSAKSTKLASNSQNLAGLLARAFPDDESLQLYKDNLVYFPNNLSDADSSIIKLNDSQIKKVLEELGPETLKKLSDRFSKLPKTTSLGGGIIEAQLTDPDLFKRVRKSTLEEDQERQRRLTKQAKTSITNMIKNGRSDSQLSAEQKNLIGRIESVELLTADSNWAQRTPECKKKSPQASYFPDSDRFLICENLLDLPDVSLLRVIAHELGHAIDPCRASCDHLTANQQKLDQYFEERKRETSEMEELPKLSDEEIALNKLIGREERPFTEITQIDDSMKNNLIKKGYLKVNYNGIPRSKQPLNPIRTCLIKSGKFDNISSKDISVALYQIQEAKKRFGEKISKKELSDLEKFFRKNSDCVHVGVQHSQMSESIADVYAAYAVADYLRDHPPKTMGDKIAIEGTFIRFVCDPHFNATVTSQFTLGTVEMISKQHPTLENRTKNILLQFPGIADHFDCNFKKSNNCFQMFNSVRSKSSSGSESKKGAQE